MLPPAPPLFSTNTEPPITCCISAAIMRAEMSEGPPGVFATTILIGRSGNAASAEPIRRKVGAARPSAIAPVALSRRRRDGFSGLLSAILLSERVIDVLPQAVVDGHARNLACAGQLDARPQFGRAVG